MQHLLHWLVCRLPNVLIGEPPMWWAGRFDGRGVWEIRQERASRFSEEDAGKVRVGICTRHTHLMPEVIMCIDLEDENGSVW